ncbi:hypothetical protein Q31b_43510 [Novipirellula aureliae]|uniref:Uncharacterized protein n=1 Tax=Novipirellula aureliae TaxID=2527966 RepID=A0A5C6DJK9_9BACT|nr:hypothetical protein [Novipirellula aureliae]TWU37563.1 hypothetical protein Q31b_43510 [Novipirellula aureliae]
MRNRRGSLILEAAISALLMVTATVALLKLAKTSSQLSRSSDQRVALQLATDNAAERMSVIPFDEIAGQTDKVAKTVSETSDCQCEITSYPFEVGDRNGIHLIMTTRISDRISRTQHRWILDRRELDRRVLDRSEPETPEDTDE